MQAAAFSSCLSLDGRIAAMRVSARRARVAPSTRRRFNDLKYLR
jgi:hypothetical protein